jgi:hypothetical protein
MRRVIAAASVVWLAVGAGTLRPAARAAQSTSAPQGSDSAGAGRVSPPAQTSARSTDQALVTRYCLGCHNARTRSGNFVLADLDVMRPGENAEAWEKVVGKLRNGLMPPAGMPRPDAAASARLRSGLEARLDAHAAAHPNPGRTEVVHRLNRIEYLNAVRDLVAVEVDPDLLPADDSSYGFDNIAGVLKMSPALVERYLTAARVVSRAAVGSPPPALGTSVYRVPPELQQHDRLDGLSFGTRGGTLIRHMFPRDAQYDIKVELRGGGSDPHRLEISIDGMQAALEEVTAGASPEVRVPVTGGPHEVGVTFYRRPLDLVEQVREPFLNPDAPSGTGGIAGRIPTVAAVTIAGPHGDSGPGDTPSRHRVFVCTPKDRADEPRCAKTILETLARRAYRGAVTPGSLDVLLDFYAQGREPDGTFEDGIEFALRRLLVSPEFLYRIEADPVNAAVRPVSSPAAVPAGVYRLSDRELASRLSFFLWSTIPDDELLAAAAKGALTTRSGLERQVTRMLADPRVESLVENFGGQWLQVRNLATARPGETYALHFDETLRQSMLRETELFLGSIIRENRGVLELLTADYTFVNERLALHYGIANVQGSHFRRVTLPADSPRRGLLGHGSILTLTSPAIRTSPVIRGKWILNNILGAPPPDPPPDVPALSDRRTQAKVRTMRERMAQHRANPGCASCHNMIDPAGFALEQFDAIGRWRTVDESFNPIDASGALPDGTSFSGAAELREALARHPERFAHTVTERLLTYALGRGVEHDDMPAIRAILREAAPGGYRFHTLVLGVVKSFPFQYRRAEAPDARVASAAGR